MNILTAMCVLTALAVLLVLALNVWAAIDYWRDPVERDIRRNRYDRYGTGPTRASVIPASVWTQRHNPADLPIDDVERRPVVL